MSTLLELSDEMRRLGYLLMDLEEAGGEDAPAELQEEVRLRLDEVAASLADKIDSYAALIEEHEARAGVLREHAQRFEKAARATENVARRLKERLLLALEGMGVEQLRGEVYSVALAQGPWRVEVMAEEPVLEAGYIRTTVEVDKQSLLRDWKQDPKAVEGLPVKFTRSRYVRVKP